MNIIDFNNEYKYPRNDETYGGLTCQKLGVFINNEPWVLKFPGNIKNFNNVEISYSTSTISEYIGSHIYELCGIEAHKTILGVKDNKIVVACKDFRNFAEHEYRENYGELKNVYIANIQEKLELYPSTNDNGESLENIELIMKNNPIFKELPDFQNRFWDMFIIDGFIGNNDRNYTNWGTLKSLETGNRRIMPVYDNGSSFANKSSDEQMEEKLNNESKFISSVYHSAISVFTLNGKNINPLKYIEKQENKELNKAMLRIIPNINMKKIFDMIDEIPKEYNGLEVLSDTRREFYKKTLEYRYDKVLQPTYQKIMEQNKTNLLKKLCDILQIPEDERKGYQYTILATDGKPDYYYCEYKDSNALIDTKDENIITDETIIKNIVSQYSEENIIIKQSTSEGEEM